MIADKRTYKFIPSFEDIGSESQKKGVQKVYAKIVRLPTLKSVCAQSQTKEIYV